jgi:hypothetical protein
MRQTAARYTAEVERAGGDIDAPAARARLCDIAEAEAATLQRKASFMPDPTHTLNEVANGETGINEAGALRAQQDIHAAYIQFAIFIGANHQARAHAAAADDTVAADQVDEIRRQLPPWMLHGAQAVDAATDMHTRAHAAARAEGKRRRAEGEPMRSTGADDARAPVHHRDVRSEMQAALQSMEDD